MSRLVPEGVSNEQITIVARRVLLAALEGLEAHREAITLVGAQAVYLRTKGGDLTTPSYTTDADLNVDPDKLADEPLLEQIMREAGFSPGQNPGSWLRKERFGERYEDVAVDLMVADEFSGPGSRRSGVIPPHGREATRRTQGLEAVVVDCDLMAVPSLEPDVDPRVIEVQVAGPAALLIAKCHKLGERFRVEEGRRMVAKDAGDVFRLMYETETRDMTSRLTKLLADRRSKGSTRQGLEYLDELFGAPGRRGVLMAIETLGAEIQAAEIETIMPAYVASLARAAGTSDA